MNTAIKPSISPIEKFKGTIKRLLYILKLVADTSKLLLCGMVIISVLEGILPLLNTYIASRLINALIEVFGNKSWDAMSPVFSLLVLQFLYLIFSRAATLLKGTLTRLAGEMVTNHIRIKISKKTKDIDLANYDDPEFYEKLENANREASTRPISIMTATLSLLSNVISAISFVSVLMTLHPLIPLALIIMAAPAAFVNFKYKKITYRYIKDHTTDRRRMHYFTNTLTNKDQVKEIKLLALHDTFIEKYKTVFISYFKGLRNIMLREDLLQLIVHTSSTIFNCAFFVFIAYQVCFNDMAVGDYTLYTGALTSVLSTVSSIVSHSSTIYEGTLFIDNMIEFMDVKPNIVPSVTPALAPKAGIAHTIEFKNVSFSYPGTSRKVIDNLNLTLSGGKSYALVGLNGAGKTTLIKLLTRLYDPTEGEILLDGESIKNYDVDKLYAMYGIVFQDFAKYAVSLRENVIFGDINAPYSEERVDYAIKQSAADDFVSKLPDGIETPLIRYFEKNATDLSIGQWQKISIARAFYKDSEILILDEPTASLDPIAEAEIFKQFDTLREGKTTLFVSHRLSSAVAADEIIVMQNGKILEQGNHHTLMENDGAYCKLFKLQAEKYLENS